MTTTVTTVKTTIFPASTVEATLRGELIDAVKADATVSGIALPSSNGEIAKAAIRIDSLVAVTILCTIEPIIGFDLPDAVVRAGGYASVNAAMEHLMPQIEKKWAQRHGVKS